MTDGWLQVVLLIEPFHRMFALDNMHLHYPYALVERVPVCEASFINFGALTADGNSLEYSIRGSTSLYSP
jgi:hypothetical protein